MDGKPSHTKEKRAVYVGNEVLAYLKKRRQKAPRGTAYIFPGSHGQPIRKDTACSNLRRIWKAAGLYQKGMPTSHWLRHSVCSRLLGAGVDIETTRRIMGHSDAATTLLYAHTSDQRLKDAARLLSGGPESMAGKK
jgi:site-specific recombinase XerD